MVQKIQNSIDMCPLDQVNILLNIMALDFWTLSEAKHGPINKTSHGYVQDQGDSVLKILEL